MKIFIEELVSLAKLMQLIFLRRKESVMYKPSEIESKWQYFWEKNKSHKVQEGNLGKKFYALGAWVYPSGDAHMGHVRNYTNADVVSRFKRMNGYNVLNPVGWDAFGLPTENAAINHNTDPFTWNKTCIEKMERQFRKLGFSYDWDLVVDTSSPDYYKWTQWILIKFWEKGLLYRGCRLVNWCEKCQTVLANEQVVDGNCERCSSSVVEKEMEQWFIRITDYAERLLDDLTLLTDWPKHVLKMQENWIGKKGSFKIRDWCISRQRYWGAPMPFVTCNYCGIQPVAEKNLPVLLPQGLDFSPGWPPPLARNSSFMETTCPKCGEKAERSCEVMDTFVFSSYYYLRFTDPKNKEAVFSQQAESYWMPVDFYISGVELANNHLIYARFFQKALYDLGLVRDEEPFKHYYAQGMVLLNGRKMSKSKGNVISPDVIVDKYGADTLRTFILFVGPPEADMEWNEAGLSGSYNFLRRLYDLVSDFAGVYEKNWQKYIEDVSANNIKENLNIRHKVHLTLLRVTEIYENSFRFNVAIALIMELLNGIEKYWKGRLSDHSVMSEAVEFIIQMISPFAPHIAEELWEIIGKSSSIFLHPWPDYSKELSTLTSTVVVVQINGKRKGTILVPSEELNNKEFIIFEAQKITRNKSIKNKRVVIVPGKIINFIL